MRIDEGLSPDAVLDRLGREGASELEAGVMRDVLLERHAGRDLAELTEGEWLAAFGEMNRRKSTGWIRDDAGPAGPA